MKKRDINHHAGFTLIELIVTMVVFSILSGFITINLFGAKHNAALSTSIDLLTADMNQQQTKAMQGDTQGTGTLDNYGVYFGSTSYTLFHGSTYSSTDSSNFTITLPDTMQLTNIALQNNQLVFAKGTGEILNYSSSNSAVTLYDSLTGVQKTVRLNRLGVITLMN